MLTKTDEIRQRIKTETNDRDSTNLMIKNIDLKNIWEILHIR